MWRIAGEPGKDLCDKHLGTTRRDLMRVGGAGMLGMTLGGMLEVKAQPLNADPAPRMVPVGTKPKHHLIYLQGGPSHLDLWDPKENVPDNVAVCSSRSKPSCLASCLPNYCPNLRR